MEKIKLEGTIKSVTPIKNYGGEEQIGFLLEEYPGRWCNIKNTKEKLTKLLSESIVKGFKIKFNLEGVDVKNLEILDRPKPKDKNIVNISGKDYMTYPGLLTKAHVKDAKFSMVITESFVSEDMKRAWCKVRLTSENQIFDGFGSSTPENTGQMTSSHPVEMAHTRAKGRALRDFLDIGEVMAEELK